jgi:hypothetical protein
MGLPNQARRPKGTFVPFEPEGRDIGKSACVDRPEVEGHCESEKVADFLCIEWT